MAHEKLKRELEREALTRLEDAARTPKDFEGVIAWWDRLDRNQEHRQGDPLWMSSSPIRWDTRHGVRC